MQRDFASNLIKLMAATEDQFPLDDFSAISVLITRIQALSAPLLLGVCFFACIYLKLLMMIIGTEPLPLAF
jgi:hypothetical protein